MQASATDEPKRPSKKTKVLVSKAPSNVASPLATVITPCKETPVVVALRKVSPLKVLRREGSSRRWDKVVP
ncbi:hypothetical protein B296_00004562 [Ensete ventricosum]|uniref:Uncharacterized protein n=1 Tax=Ensete ventricosum TaxID=4639 RepID=A0A427AYV5_ENSVE|nr:hypothetical protein B296_00004562 [Ensete ventricosum]